jgi:hypothetical protein
LFNLITRVAKAPDWVDFLTGMCFDYRA